MNIQNFAVAGKNYGYASEGFLFIKPFVRYSLPGYLIDILLLCFRKDGQHTKGLFILQLAAEFYYVICSTKSLSKHSGLISLLSWTPVIFHLLLFLMIYAFSLCSVFSLHATEDDTQVINYSFYVSWSMMSKHFS